MDSWTGKKRSWEGDNPTELQRKRQASPSTASTTWQPSLHPPQAGYYSGDSHIIAQRRLPPLYTQTHNTSAEAVTTVSPSICTPAPETTLLDQSKPGSQSLANGLQRFDWQGQQQVNTAYPIDSDRTLGPNLSPPLSGTDVQRSSGFPAPHAPGTANCCSSDCLGQECSNSRILIHKLATELTLLDTEVRNITQPHHQSSCEASEPDHQNAREALRWAINLVQWTNRILREYTAQRSPHDSESHLHPNVSLNMRRGSHHIEEREEQAPGTRQHPMVHHGRSGFTLPRVISEEPRRNPYGSDPSPIANSPHRTPSSSGSVFIPPQSPMQAPQPMRPDILPSPSSLHYATVQALPPISPPIPLVQTSAQSAHLQDLQHQISVKTLAFQTLQREYDSLLQKLERQRTKCATLEKKFEVTDVEINSLLDEKEKLQMQVSVLETQVEDLQQSRDEARHQLVTNGAQYMRIMEMASRLQAQGAEDEKKWRAERKELEQRIQLLEEAMVTGTEHPALNLEEQPGDLMGPPSIVQAHSAASSSSSHAETIIVLRAEITRLRSRTQTLETALQSIRCESISIQTAARQLAEAGGKLESIAQDTVGGSG